MFYIVVGETIMTMTKSCTLLEMPIGISIIEIQFLSSFRHFTPKCRLANKIPGFFNQTSLSGLILRQALINVVHL